MRWFLLWVGLAVVVGGFAADVRAGQPLQWHSWVDATIYRQSTVAGPYVWSAGASVIWRVDRRTGDVLSYTALQGLPLQNMTPTNITGASDGQFACVLHDLIYHFDTQGKVSSIKPPSKSKFRISFGPDDRLYLLEWSGTIWQRKVNQWQAVCDVPPSQNFMPTADGFVLSSIANVKGFGYIPRQGGVYQPLAHDKLNELDVHWSPIKINNQMIGQFRGAGGLRVLATVDDGKLIEKATNADGMDLSSCAGMTMDRGDRGLVLRTVGQVGSPIRPSPLHETYWRDEAGAIWSGPMKWDGKQEEWIEYLPPMNMGDVQHLADDRYYRRVPATNQWIHIADKLGPAYRQSLDSATMIFWRSRYIQKTPGQNTPVLQQMKVQGDQHEPVRTVELPQRLMFGLPQFKDRQGNWWAVVTDTQQNKFYITRIDPQDQVHLYECGRGIDGGWRPQIQLSPTGNVWVWEEKLNKRYDPKTDMLVKDEPQQDFAFTFGPWTLSMTGPISSAGQPVHRKMRDGWEPLPQPFAIPGNQGKVLGTQGMFHGDRMLVNVRGLGICEYDATEDRWVLLHGLCMHKARFTPDGCRLLTHAGNALLLEGDPFAPQPVDRKELAEISQLLKLLEDDQWRVREEATQKLKKLYPQMSKRINALLKDPDLPPETRMRLELIVDKGITAGLVSLFEQMHPTIKPPSEP